MKGKHEKHPKNGNNVNMQRMQSYIGGAGKKRMKKKDNIDDSCCKIRKNFWIKR